MNKFADMRKSYESGVLDEAMVLSNPIEQFNAWFSEVMEYDPYEANSFVLATVDKEGQPHARTLLLKGLSHTGFEFYTNYDSAKANELSYNSKAAMCFLWLGLERQVRIEGQTKRLSQESSLEYFHSRPRESQIGAWVSPQSKVIASRSILDERQEEMNQRFANLEQIPLPPNWGGYCLKPHKIEFWQGRQSRLHDRIAYCLEQGVWKIHRLAP